MANRYWVGTSGETWDTIAGSKWATTSGGAGGASVPTADDDVFFDANSGNGIVIPYEDAVCLSIDFTGWTGDFGGDSSTALSIYKSLTLGAGMTYTNLGTVYFLGSENGTITSNGVTMTGRAIRIIKSSSSSSITLTDSLIYTGSILVLSATFITANNNLTGASLYFSSDDTSTFYMGSSTVEITGSITVLGSLLFIAPMSLYCGTSTLKFTGTYTGTSTIRIYLQGKTFYNIWNDTTVTSTGSFAFLNSCTCSEFKVSGGSDMRVGTLSTITANVFSFLADVSNPSVIKSYSSGVQYTLSQATGVIDTNYVDVEDSNVVGGAIWYWGANNTDSGNNTGWHYRWTNTAEMYSSDDTYATAPATSGDLDVYLSKDAGLNWQLVRSKTFDGTEASLTYGDGDTELWGASWTGDDVDNTSFRVRLQHGQYVAILKDFGSSVPAGNFINGIKVIVEAKYSSSTFSVDHVNVTFYYSNTTLPVQEGSVVYATDGRKNGEGAGSGTGVLVFYDGSNWIAVDSGQTVDD